VSCLTQPMATTPEPLPLVPAPGGLGGRAPAWYAATRAASRWIRPGSSDSARVGAGPGSGRRGISVIR
jgi:hypothetical protein